MRPVSAWLTALRTSFWFLPIVMAIGAAVVARLALYVEVDVPLGRDGDGQEAGLLLSTLAGSLITVTGVVFSLTVVTLHLASNQYGPRLLRSFMRDRGTQLVLGTFVATFVFCIVSLVGQPPPNSLPVALALVFTAASVVVLIYFIHHLAMSIQAESIVGAVAKQLEYQIDHMYPERSEHAEAHLPTGRPGVVRASADGYVVSIDHDALLEAATDAKTDLQVLVREGHYIVDGDALMLGWSDQTIPQSALDAITIESRRTEADDVEFSIQQLTQMAARALSTGINDPYTAVACIHRLTSAHCRLAGRDDSPRVKRQDGSTVVVPRATFEELLRAGLGAIRHHADSPQVQGHLIDGLGRVAVSVEDPARRRAVRAELDALAEDVERAGHPQVERDRLQDRFRRAITQLERTAAPIDPQRR